MQSCMAVIGLHAGVEFVCRRVNGMEMDEMMRVDAVDDQAHVLLEPHRQLLTRCVVCSLCQRGICDEATQRLKDWVHSKSSDLPKGVTPAAFSVIKRQGCLSLLVDEVTELLLQWSESKLSSRMPSGGMG